MNKIFSPIMEKGGLFQMDIINYCALALIATGAFLLYKIIKHDNGTGENGE